MPVEQAIAAAPALLPEKTAKDYQTSPIPGIEGADFAVGLDDDTKTKIDRLAITGLPATTPQLLAQAWGPGKDAKDSIDRARTYWFDPATGWRAYAEVSYGDEYNIEFHNYIPYTKLLGDAPDVIAFAPQGLVGKTIDELRANHKDTIVETTAEQEAQKRKDLEKFAGEKLDELGATRADARLDLPPTEWEAYWTRIGFHWSDKNTILAVWISIPFQAHPAAKDEIFAFFKKKWGEPKEFEDLGEKAFEFRKENPRIVVKEDTITHAWKIELSPKED
jgi:hypothetical protein